MAHEYDHTVTISVIVATLLPQISLVFVSCLRWFGMVLASTCVQSRNPDVLWYGGESDTRLAETIASSLNSFGADLATCNCNGVLVFILRGSDGKCSCNFCSRLLLLVNDCTREPLLQPLPCSQTLFPLQQVVALERSDFRKTSGREPVVDEKKDQHCP